MNIQCHTSGVTDLSNRMFIDVEDEFSMAAGDLPHPERQLFRVAVRRRIPDRTQFRSPDDAGRPGRRRRQNCFRFRFGRQRDVGGGGECARRRPAFAVDHGDALRRRGEQRGGVGA